MKKGFWIFLKQHCELLYSHPHQVLIIKTTLDPFILIKKDPTSGIFLERVTGIEPVYSAWKADIIAVILYPHTV